MKKILFLGMLIFFNTSIYAQINLADSSVQVIGFWDKNEKQSYGITLEKYKIKGIDTAEREKHTYTVDISIIDSFADSYIINWYYKDYNIETENPLKEKLSTLFKDMNVKIRTNEFGVFLEVINWEEIRHFILKATQMLKIETKDMPGIEEFITDIEKNYTSKESIEAIAINDIRQFYVYHGLKYEYKFEYEAELKTSNIRGGEPFDTKVIYWLDEIDSAENNYMIRMQQSINSEQLTLETYKYLNKIAEDLKQKMPKYKNFKKITNNTWTTSIIHEYGWVIYSIETKEIQSDGETIIQERTIELL